ncbi:MAG: hypothetical protein KDJ80_07050, partial [Nitratireductor sp.]|nr:hypothetical protein [Nitratireductor sp.]
MAAPSLFALSLILGAAVMHALWNAMIKGAGDRVLAMGLINIGHAVPGAVMVLAFLPPADEAWPFIIASTVIHYFYYGFLLLAYRHGDLSQVYPIARGVAPVLVALGGQWFAGEYLPLQAWLGILLVSAAIGFLMFAQRRQPANRITVLAALATGVIIASYSIVDGLGVRASQNPF